MSEAKIRLNEVTLMRMILAILIVFMHSFTCYNHGWREPAGFVEIPLYKWLSRTSFAFTLEAFVFISGYLFAFQRITLNRNIGCIKMIISKLKRLILPSIIFSAIYFTLFYSYKGFGNMVYSILNGCGHMWYLPMLFWCFILTWLLLQIKMKEQYRALILLALYFCSFLPLPFRMNNALSFLVFFYAGYLFYKNAEKIKSWITGKSVAWLWSVFVVAFVLLRPLKDSFAVQASDGMVQKLIFLSLNNTCRLMYAFAGLVAFYAFSVWFTQRRDLNSFTNRFAGACFGIYLFQQFILQILYYKTSFPVLVGPYWLPWLGFVIALPLSYLLSVLLLKTRIGRFLIG